MTPEERADAVAGKFVAFGQGRPTRVALVMEISDAIRAAVEEEREACAKTADTIAYNWSLHHSVAPAAAYEVAKAIRARGQR